MPAWQSSADGPFDLWPTGLGFDYFYGFIGGDTDQWDPTVFVNTIPVEPKEKLTGAAKANYNLDADLADQAIHWIQQQHSLAPNKPFFAYYAPGATHAPHHVPKEWIAKFKGQFDQGWDKLREETFARQKKLGVIPQDAILTPRPANMPAWDSLDAKHKELFSHMAEIYAAFLAYDDYNIGRVIDSLKQEGVSDNTLVIFMEGDNGGSAEGTLQGTANEIGVIGNGAKESFDYLYSIKDQLGGPLHYNHMPVPWSWAFDTPFQWTKRYASHFGGTRNGMVMSWPGHIKDVGGLREQFHYVTDILPTILEVAKVQAPDTINGVKQLPFDGVSMTYTWDDAKAPTPSRHAIVRDVRQSRHLSRRLDGLDHPAGLRLGAGAQGPNARELQLGALRPPQGFFAGRGSGQGRAGKAQSKWRSSGGRKRAATTPCR